MNTPNLNAALCAAQSEFKAVVFDATNPFLKNKFASLGACISSTRPVLAKHGLSITQQPVGDGVKIGVITTIRHSSGEESASEISLPLGEERGKSQAQLAGSIITYLRRYSLSGVLGLYADEDTDGHQDTPPAGKPVSTPATAPAATAPAPTKATAKKFTDADRVRFVDLLLNKHAFPVEHIQQYAVKRSIILTTEQADTDWPLSKLPTGKAEFETLVKDIKSFCEQLDNVPY